ncbi:MAG: ROK family transcriptional regulator [Proteobacteria bacterium]|uniref:ROK family transcriptional regulator n=1 Tax=Rudaea sp. TaxID=2136325 RepID=UPI003783E4B3|nr:ROK family transcriptional regulator [Pseudomonadota bacterium]
MSLQLDYNEKHVIDLLRSHGPQSRSRLVHSAQLTPPTLTRLTQNLLDYGLLKELHKVRDGQRGKPAQLITLDPNGAFAIGIAVQSEYLSACIVDLEGNPRASLTRNLSEPNPSLVATYSRKMFEQLLDEAAVPRKRVIGAGVSMPGVALNAYGAGLNPSGPHRLPDEYSAWKGIDLPAHFRKALGLQSWLDNSAKTATLADMYFGAGRQLNHFAAFHFAYGFGGGLILDRRPYRGRLGRAGEFGGLYPYEHARPSGHDLLDFLAERMDAPPRQIRDLSQARIPEGLIKEWLARVSPQVLDLARHLSVALDLEAIVLNGLLPMSVLQPMAQLLREQLPRAIPNDLGVPEIIVSQLAKSGLDLGAASLPLHYVTSASSY